MNITDSDPMLNPINDDMEWKMLSQNKNKVNTYSKPNNITSHSLSQKHFLDDSENTHEQLIQEKKEAWDQHGYKRQKKRFIIHLLLDSHGIKTVVHNTTTVGC